MVSFSSFSLSVRCSLSGSIFCFYVSLSNILSLFSFIFWKAFLTIGLHSCTYKFFKRLDNSVEAVVFDILWNKISAIIWHFCVNCGSHFSMFGNINLEQEKIRILYGQLRSSGCSDKNEMDINIVYNYFAMKKISRNGKQSYC